MRAKEFITESTVDEMALPADWDPTALGHDKTFKSRLDYAKQKAPRLGGGSSRVAFVIPDQGRETVLKIAKNKKGMAQNEAELDILKDGYIGQLDIVIPLVDYDKANSQPTWIQTELAKKASEKQLCAIMKCDNLQQLVNMAWAITGKKKYLGNYQAYASHLLQTGHKEEDIETMTDYANTLADLNNSFDVELGDFGRAANWGMYEGKPVIIDVGFNSNVMQQYYTR